MSAPRLHVDVIFQTLLAVSCFDSVLFSLSNRTGQTVLIQFERQTVHIMNGLASVLPISIVSIVWRAPFTDSEKSLLERSLSLPGELLAERSLAEQKQRPQGIQLKVIVGRKSNGPQMPFKC